MRNVSQVLVLDRLALTGEALVDLFDRQYGCGCSRHFTRVRSLHEALVKTLACQDAGMTMVVMELVTDEDSLSDCLVLLKELEMLSAMGCEGLRVLVYTAVTEPLVLKGLHAGSIVLRREPLPALLLAARDLLSEAPAGMMMSAGVRAQLGQKALLPLTARELECLVRLAGKPRRGYRSLSREMGCTYKTACAHRRALARKLGLASVLGLRNHLRALQHTLGYW